LESIQAAALKHGVTVILGMIERPAQRSGTSLYCSIAYIDGATGRIAAIHRKIMPTYEERLVWSPGDGAGIVTHALNVTHAQPAAQLDKPAKPPALAAAPPYPVVCVPHPSPWVVGVLNCYESWLPLMRAALHGMGENLHFSLWPGSGRNTRDMTRFYALEGRSFAVSVSAVLRLSDILPENVPHHELVVGSFATSGVAADADKLAQAVGNSPAGEGVGATDPNILCDGGSCVAAPDGSWLLSPDSTCDAQEGVFVVELDYAQVVRERQCLDISGHYSRPDVLQLTVNRQRQATVRTVDGPGSYAHGTVSILNPQA
jgi:nitrilase